MKFSSRTWSHWQKRADAYFYPGGIQRYTSFDYRINQFSKGESAHLLILCGLSLPQFFLSVVFGIYLWLSRGRLTILPHYYDHWPLFLVLLLIAFVGVISLWAYGILLSQFEPENLAYSRNVTPSMILIAGCLYSGGFVWIGHTTMMPHLLHISSDKLQVQRIAQIEDFYTVSSRIPGPGFWVQFRDIDNRSFGFSISKADYDYLSSDDLKFSCEIQSEQSIWLRYDSSWSCSEI